jgi:hypothetical protein
MKHPELTPIKSSAMTGYAYDPDKRELHIQFPGGAVHAYSDVPIEKVEAMKGAQSVGGYFTSKIKSVHKARRIV